MDSEDLDDDVMSQLIELSEAAENAFSQNQASSSHKGKGEPGPEHLEVLSKYFGHANFRPMQWEIIRAIIRERRDVCAVMCTGYGKSLCFQYPSTFMGGVTLVVSPLISLMEDQILSLEVSNIPACLLGSAQKSYGKVISEIFNNVYSLIYVTPEFCSGEFGTDLLKRMSKELSVTLIAIDEAHCISSWGHDFRHQYRKLGLFHDVFPDVPIMAVTATATVRVREDIVKSLNLRNPLMVVSGFNRPNLYFEVHQKGATGPFHDLTKAMVYENSQWKFSGSTIIYCITRKQTEDVDQILKMNGIKSRLYHAGLSMSLRKEAHELFVRDKIDVVVATIAFGMGIDKPDVRNVIHYGCSKSIESYYQEVGRAGRDGLPSKCVTFYSNADFATLRNLATSNGRSGSQEVNNLNMIEHYLCTRQCRRRFILEYFEDKLDESEEAQRNCCDNCTKKLCDSRTDQEKYEGIDEKGCYDFTKDARIILGAISTLGSGYGISTHVLFVRGSNSAKLQRFKTHALHGSGRHQSEEWWKAIAKLLTEENYLKETVQKIKPGFSYCAISITNKGISLKEKIAKNEGKLMLPPSSTLLKLLKTKPQKELGWLNVSTKITQPTTVSKPAETESEQEIEERMQLYHKLLDVRSELATNLDCMPYTVASNTALMKMSRFKPASLDQLKSLNLDGFTEAKIMKFGHQFLRVINESDVEVQGKKLSIKEILFRHPLPDNKGPNLTAEVSYTLFKSGLTVGEIAVKRSVTTGTITSHLVAGMKIGHPIKMIELGVTEDIRDTIMKVVQEKSSDFNNVRRKEIKDECPPDITYEQINVVLAYLQVRQHLEKLNLPYEEFEDFEYSEVVGKRSADDAKLDAVSCGDEVKDDLDETVDLDDQCEPPTKREKTDFDTILDSPPSSVCEEPPKTVESSPVEVAEEKVSTPVKKSKKRLLPPWLIAKKVN